MGGPSMKTIISSSLLFIPATVALFTQAPWVALLLWLTSIASLIYHISSEDDDFVMYDMIFACLSVAMFFYSLAALLCVHGSLHLRVLVPLCIGVAAGCVYVFAAHKNLDHRSEDDYHNYHMIWHVLITVAALALYVYPIDHSVLHNSTYRDIFSGKCRQQALRKAQEKKKQPTTNHH